MSILAQPTSLDMYMRFFKYHCIYVKSAASCCEWDFATQLSRPRPKPWWNELKVSRVSRDLGPSSLERPWSLDHNTAVTTPSWPSTQATQEGGPGSVVLSNDQATQEGWPGWVGLSNNQQHETYSNRTPSSRHGTNWSCLYIYAHTNRPISQICHTSDSGLRLSRRVNLMCEISARQPANAWR